MSTSLAPGPLAETFEAPLGVQSQTQVVVDAAGGVIGVFVPGAPALGVGTRVVVNLTLGVSFEPAEGVVTWVRGRDGSRVRPRAGLGLTFAALTDAQRSLLERGRLLHETTVVPPPPAPDYELQVGDDVATPDYELKLED